MLSESDIGDTSALISDQMNYWVQNCDIDSTFLFGHN